MQDGNQDRIGWYHSDHIQTIAKGVCTGIGLVILIIGLMFSIDLFRQIYTALKSPEVLSEPVGVWSKLLGLEGMKIHFGGSAYSISNLVSIGILGVGAYLLINIALSMMQVGAKIVFASNERILIKRIVREIIDGSNLRPDRTMTDTEQERKS